MNKNTLMNGMNIAFIISAGLTFISFIIWLLCGADILNVSMIIEDGVRYSLDEFINFVTTWNNIENVWLPNIIMTCIISTFITGLILLTLLVFTEETV